MPLRDGRDAELGGESIALLASLSVSPVFYGAFFGAPRYMAKPMGLRPVSSSSSSQKRLSSSRVGFEPWRINCIDDLRATLAIWPPEKS